jgi:hypothetical protein
MYQQIVRGGAGPYGGEVIAGTLTLGKGLAEEMEMKTTSISATKLISPVMAL